MRSLGARSFLAGAIAGAVALSACGKEETVELLGQAPDAGSLFDVSQPSGDSSRPCDFVAAGQPRACRGDGAPCAAPDDCCSTRCEGNVCLAPGTCAGPGAACTTRDACCSGRCEPSGGGGRTCTNYCLADGASCTSAMDCCSLGCNGGVCGGALCAQEESPCSSNSECCSGACDGDVKRCRTRGCKGTGEECEAAECCSGTCTSGGGSARCDEGPGPCRPTGTFCSTDGDCCRPPCAVGANGYKVCAAVPQPDGQGCTTGADCVSKICSGTPPVCGAPGAQCKFVGSPCDVASDCCSDQCQAGFCASNCLVH